MLRVTDVKAALEAFPVAPRARGEVVLTVEDAVLPQNALAWRVTARAGRLDVAPAPGRGGRGRTPRLTVPADLLGPILAGTVAPTAAAAAGLIGSDGGAETVEPWFASPPAFLHPMNVF